MISPSAVLGDGLRLRQVVLRHVIPRVVEATIIPSAIFYVVWHLVGVWAALLAALAWAVALIARRVIRGHRVPALLVMGILGLTARTLLGLATGSTFVYFLQPVFGTAAISAAFFGSVLLGRPLVNRLAGDFCPLADADTARHGVQRLYRGLTLFWASVLLTNAVVTLTLLLTLSVDTFVLVKTLMTPLLTASAVVFTIVWATRVGRREGLVSVRRRHREAFVDA